jgi:uncharacterized membrane protein YhhN
MMGVILAMGAIGMVYYWLHDYLGTLLVPVVTYMFIIGTVWVFSFNLSNHSQYKKTAYYFFIPGMFLFVLSDSLLALNKFLLHYPVRWDGWIILAPTFLLKFAAIFSNCANSTSFDESYVYLSIARKNGGRLS